MGYMSHHAIVVSSWDEKLARKAHAKAIEACAAVASEAYHGTFAEIVSPLCPSVANGYHSFAIFTDGSKEGWDTSDLGDHVRAMFIAWADAQRHEDGSTSLRWVEVQYGDDYGKTRVVRHSDESRR